MFFFLYVWFLHWCRKYHGGEGLSFFFFFLNTRSHLNRCNYILTYSLYLGDSILKPSHPHVCMIPRHSRLHQPAVGLLPQHYLIGEGVSLPELLSAPLSSVGAQPATLMAAAPVRQRSGSVGPRAQLPPCYYEGYLEKRGPKEKVGSARCGWSAMLFLMHAVVSSSLYIYMYVCVCTAHRLISPFPESCQLPRCVSMGEAILCTAAGLLHIIAGHRFVVLCKSLVRYQEACNNLWTNRDVWSVETRLLSKHCHLHPTTGRIGGAVCSLSVTYMQHFHHWLWEILCLTVSSMNCIRQYLVFKVAYSKIEDIPQYLCCMLF